MSLTFPGDKYDKYDGYLLDAGDTYEFTVPRTGCFHEEQAPLYDRFGAAVIRRGLTHLIHALLCLQCGELRWQRTGLSVPTTTN